MLVIGTSALVYLSMAHIKAARRKGARVAVVGTEKEDPRLLGLEEQYCYLQGDVAEIITNMVKPLVSRSD
jgi:NAD-dependent SIR2 family protein deacetylase